jgi:PKD repeat protein
MNKQLNFKVVGLFLLILISTLSFKTTYATHALGADIATICIAPNTYQVTLSVYRDCNGVNLGSTQNLRYFSTCAGLDSTIAISKLSETDITQVCPGGQSACNGGTGTVGVEKFIYQTIITLPSTATCDVTFSWRLCTRSNSITTLTAPGATCLYTETVIDNSVATCNNSPEFTLDPILYFPVNQPASLNYLVSDIDGDSLYYSMVDALSNTGTTVNYAAGHSGALPLGASVPITIDQNTGTITFTPNAAAVAVFAIKIEEYRNGVLIGSVTRDMNVTILPIPNSSPIISGLSNGLASDTVLCSGQFFTTKVYLTGSSNTFIQGIISNNVPGLAISQQIVNSDTTILTLSWFPTAANIGNNIFYVVAKSDECPVKLISSKGFNLVVSSNPPITSTSVLNNPTCATSNDGSAYHITTGLLPGYTVTWYDASATIVGTSDTLQNASTGWYTVRISNGPGYCTIEDNVFLGHNNSTTSTASFTMVGQTGCSAPHTTTFTDQSTVNDISCGTVWAWTFGDGGTSTLQNPSHSYTAVGNYPVSLTITDCSVSCPTTVWDTVKISTPTVDFTGTSLLGCAPLTSNFSDASASPAGITAWNWSFGDGNTATTQNPSNIYLTPGNYTVSLTVTDGNGCTTSPEIKSNYVAVSLTLNTTDTQVACDSYLWIDGNTYTSSNNTATQTLTAASGCDSIVTLDLTINNSTGTTDTQVACDTYTWSDGSVFTASNNTATQTFTNAAGCDSIITLDLTINNSSSSTDTQVACNTFTWIDGNTYTSSNNTATQTFTNAAGCDSVVTLDLTINNSTTGTDTQVACDSYLWIDGNTYSVSNNTAIVTLNNAAGCDSVVTLDLTINNSNTGTDTQVACNTFVWIDGNTYSASNNTATFTLTNTAGCDSVVTLDLTINNSNTGIDTQVACDTLVWIDGNVYSASNNTATFTLTNTAGCDSVVTLDLTINVSTSSTDTQVACDTFTWIDGNTYTASNNTATQTFTNAAGCDSIVTLDLIINNSSTSTDVQAACDTYIWIDGNTYTASNSTAMFTLANAAGCDSVVTLDLTINNSNTGVDTQIACDTLTWIDGIVYSATNNSATFTLTNAAGCDSVVTLDLTINSSNTGTDTQVACDTMIWIDGNVYSASNNTATFTLTNTAGCDSVVTLDLTINNSNTGIDTQVACDSLTWIDGNVYTLSNNTAMFTLTNAAGCDSIVTLDLTINNSIATIDNQIACDTYTWIDGNTYTASNNTATQTFTSVSGCDSVVTLSLVILNSTTGIDTQATCVSYNWIDGNTYTTSNNTATFTLTNAAGCDSVVTLNLSIDVNINVTDVQTACDSLTWIDGITYFTNNNSAVDTLIAAAGCDSIVTLDLTISTATSGTDTVFACDSLTWIDGITYVADNNSATFMLVSGAGCDSLVTLDLTVGSVDTTVTQSGDTLMSNHAGALATYQWIDCGNGNAILPGDTNQSYLVTIAGDYAVIITDGTCSDTSTCVNVTLTGVEPIKSNSDLKVYPNPTTGNAFVSLNGFGESEITITDLTGKVLYLKNNINSSKEELPTADFAKGIYLVRIKSDNQYKVVKLIKQ